MVHHWIALVVFILFALAGFVLTIVGIGGTFLVLFGALMYDLISWSLIIPGEVLLWLLGLAIFGELLEWLITLLGYKAGMSTKGLIGTVVGAIVGGILLSVIPIIGTIIGIVAGAILGAFIMEYIHTGKKKKAWKAAKIAFYGRGLVSLVKVSIAVVQIVLIMKIII